MIPRWLSWMFIAVMLYMIYAASSAQRSAPAPLTPVAVPVISKDTYPALAAATDVEHWKRRINPDYAAVTQCALDAPVDGALALKVVEDATGDGEGAACGEIIAVRLTVWNAAGGKAYEGDLPLALGTRALAAGLDAGLIGIKPGGVRTLLLPPHATLRSKKSDAPAAARKALPPGKLAVVTAERVK